MSTNGDESLASPNMQPGTPKNVVVVGMPRSGTSLVAGIFGRLGYFAAADPDEELRSGDHHNPGGYWEAETLTRLNAALLAEAGLDEDNTWLGEAISDDVARRISDLPVRDEHRAFVASYEARAPWIWKDPRLCYTLGFWWPLLPAADTRVLLTRRDPEAIWQSFVRLHWREPTPAAKADVLGRIEHHMEAARSALALRGIPHLEVQYEAFAEDPVSMAAKLSDLLGVELAPEDLSFRRTLDHSGWRGRVATFLEHRYEQLPPALRGAAKRLAPRRLVRALFPERNTG